MSISPAVLGWLRPGICANRGFDEHGPRQTASQHRHQLHAQFQQLAERHSSSNPAHPRRPSPRLGPAQIFDKDGSGFGPIRDACHDMDMLDAKRLGVAMRAAKIPLEPILLTRHRRKASRGTGIVGRRARDHHDIQCIARQHVEDIRHSHVIGKRNLDPFEPG